MNKRDIIIAKKITADFTARKKFLAEIKKLLKDYVDMEKEFDAILREIDRHLDLSPVYNNAVDILEDMKNMYEDKLIPLVHRAEIYTEKEDEKTVEDKAE